MGKDAATRARNTRNDVFPPYYNLAACGGKRYQNSIFKDKLLTGKFIVLGIFLVYVGIMCAIHGKALIEK